MGVTGRDSAGYRTSVIRETSLKPKILFAEDFFLCPHGNSNSGLCFVGAKHVFQDSFFELSGERWYTYEDNSLNNFTQSIGRSWRKLLIKTDSFLSLLSWCF